MSKILGQVNTLKIDKTLPYLDGYIFGLKDYSVNFLNTYNLDELKDLIIKLKGKNKEIYISINKNLHNKEINELRKILIEIDNLNINGIMYADNGFITLKKELDLKTNLIWYQEHLTTSYSSINTYKEFDIDSVVISNDITFHEVKEIIDNTNSKLYYMIFGYLPMFISERNQIKNYENNFKLEGSTEYNYFVNDNMKYPIIDKTIGTFAFSNLPIFAYKEYLEIKDKIHYVILSDLFIDCDTYIKVLDKVKNEKDIDLDIETSPNFLYQDTIYKIK